MVLRSVMWRNYVGRESTSYIRAGFGTVSNSILHNSLPTVAVNQIKSKHYQGPGGKHRSEKFDDLIS